MFELRGYRWIPEKLLSLQLLSTFLRIPTLVRFEIIEESLNVIPLRQAALSLELLEKLGDRRVGFVAASLGHEIIPDENIHII